MYYECVQERCDCAQMHFLSIQMEPVLHEGCPHNCQDLLSWLPFNLVIHIFSFLDPGMCILTFYVYVHNYEILIAVCLCSESLSSQHCEQGLVSCSFST